MISFKQLHCRHEYIKTELIKSERKNNDNLVIYSSFYKCQKCEYYFTVQNKIEVEKDFYINNN